MACYPEVKNFQEGNQSSSPHGYPPSLVSTSNGNSHQIHNIAPQTTWSHSAADMARNPDQNIPVPDQGYSAMSSTQVPNPPHPGPPNNHYPHHPPPPPNQDDDLRPNYPRFIPGQDGLRPNYPSQMPEQDDLRPNYPRFIPGQDGLRPNYPSQIQGQGGVGSNYPNQIPEPDDLRPNYPRYIPGQDGVGQNYPSQIPGNGSVPPNYSSQISGQDNSRPNYPHQNPGQDDLRPNFPCPNPGQNDSVANYPGQNPVQDDSRPHYPHQDNKHEDEDLRPNYPRPNAGLDKKLDEKKDDDLRPNYPHPNAGQYEKQDEKQDDDLRPNYPRPNAGQYEKQDDDLRPNYPRPNAGQYEKQDDDLRPNYPRPNAGQYEKQDDDFRPNYPRPNAGQCEKQSEKQSEKQDDDLRPNYPRRNAGQAEKQNEKQADKQEDKQDDDDLRPNYPRRNAGQVEKQNEKQADKQEDKQDDDDLRPNYPRRNARKKVDDSKSDNARRDSKQEDKEDDDDDDDLRPNYPHPRHFLPVQTEYNPEQYYPQVNEYDQSPIKSEPGQINIDQSKGEIDQRENRPVKIRPFRNPARRPLLPGSKREPVPRPFDIAAVLLGCDPKSVPRHGLLASGDDQIVKRVNHDLSTKYRAVRMMEQFPDMKQTEIARELGIPSNTVATWWRNKERIIRAYESSEFGPKVKKMRKAAYPDVEDAVDNWLREAKQSDIPITGPVIMKKAEGFAQEFGHTDFVCTQGWLARFQNRKNIKLRDLRRDLPSPGVPGFELPPYPEIKADPDSKDAGSESEDMSESGGLSRLEQTSVQDVEAGMNMAAQQAERKRRFVNRKVFDLHTRYKALKTLETNPDMRKGDVATMYNVPRNTLSTWLKNKDQIIQSYEMSKFSPNAKRMRGANLKDVEEALELWLRDAIDKDMPISQIIISKKAEELAKSLGHKDFVCTPGWLTRFQGRKNIRLREINKRSRSMSSAGETSQANPDYSLPDSIAERIYIMNSVNPKQETPREENAGAQASFNTASQNYHNEIAQLYNLYPRPNDPDPRLAASDLGPSADPAAEAYSAVKLQSETLSVIDDVRKKLEKDLGNEDDDDMEESGSKEEPMEQGLQTKAVAPKLHGPKLQVNSNVNRERWMLGPENLAPTRENARESLTHLRTYLESQPDTQLLFPYLANIEKFVQNSDQQGKDE